MTNEQYDIYALTIPDIICLYAIGGIDASELVKVSEYMITSGADSECLVDIMASEDLTTDEITKLFEKSIEELGYVLPSNQEAAITLSKKIAAEILSGTKSPYEGAMYIWKNIIRNSNDIPDELWPFKSNASAIEDALSHVKSYVGGGDPSEYVDLIQACESEILDSAKQLCVSL
ncbi:MAG: hypothetical protein PVI97_18745 [Candidatus Thiodiazotropha sp.]|jgi:hypothetical protein